VRQAIHEVSHAIIAVLNGYNLLGVHLDGPSNNPGYITREIPGGYDGNDPIWSRKELALFCAGYVGERVIYGWNEESYVKNSDQDSDWWVIRQCAVVHLDIEKDINEINQSVDPGGDPLSRILWRDVLPQLAWDQYDTLIRTVEDEVYKQLQDREFLIWRLARILNQEKFMEGPRFSSAVA